MSQETTKTEQKVNALLSTKVKSANVKIFPEAALGYLAGPCLALVSNGVVNTYLVQYWDKVLGLSKWAQTFEVLLPILSSILIIAGNLLVGKLMERKPSFIGKARPFILIAMPLIAIALVLLFWVPFPTDAISSGDPSSGIWTLIMIAIGYNLYYAIAYPFYYTSHSALVNLSTRNGSARSLLATASNAAMLGASGLAGMVGPFIVDGLDLLASDQTLEAQQAANNKWFILMIVMIVCLVIGCVCEFYFTRERITEESFNQQNSLGQQPDQATEPKKVPMKEQIKICTTDKYWWFVIIFFFLYQLGGMLKNNDLSWYSEAFTGKYALSGTVSTIGAIPTALGMIVIWPLANKFGKANCIKVGAFIAFLMGCLGFLVLPVAGNEGAVWGITIAVFCLKALGTVPAMYISLALLSDVLDHQEALYGKRTDGFTMAIYGSIMVAMTGIANGIIVAFNNAFTDTWAKQITHTTIFFGGESLCYLIIGLMFLFMNVEKFSKLDHEAIVADQKAKAEAAGIEFVSPEETLKLQEEEANRLAEEEEIENLRRKCEKKGLDFDAELAARNTAKTEKAKLDAEKKAKAEEKKAERARIKAEEAQARYDALSEEQKAEYDATMAAKEQKREEYEAAVAEEFGLLRKKTESYRAA